MNRDDKVKAVERIMLEYFYDGQVPGDREWRLVKRCAEAVVDAIRVGGGERSSDEKTFV